MPRMPRTILRACAVTRDFVGVRALDSVSMEVRAGEVLALVGENGAGKSTLLKIFAGVIEPTSGTLESVDDAGVTTALRLRNTRDASHHGIALVHQELNLAENLDIAGAILLGREPNRFGWMDVAAMRREASVWLARVGLDMDPGTLCGTLSIARRQQVEIAKALSARSRILILDEPTSSLSAHETTRLLDIMRELRDAGQAVVFVTHHLNEVLRIADRVVVLRDGRMAGELAGADIQRGRIEELMVGKSFSGATRARQAQDRPRNGPRDGSRGLMLHRVVSTHRRRAAIDLHVSRGEIVGLAGLVGAGRTELLEAIAGVGACDGAVSLDGVSLSGTVSSRVDAGVAIVPEDRARDGLFLRDAVGINVSVAWLPRGARFGVVDRAAERGVVTAAMERLRMSMAARDRTAQTLSGGNQQKSLFARWLAMKPRLWLLDEPTRGVDIAARHEIHEAIREAARGGAAVLFASSEMEELEVLADRVVVMHDGAIVGELGASEIDSAAILRLATGGVLS